MHMHMHMCMCMCMCMCMWLEGAVRGRVDGGVYMKKV
jgi:hypothetical protein